MAQQKEALWHHSTGWRRRRRRRFKWVERGATEEDRWIGGWVEKGLERREENGRKGNGRDEKEKK